MAQTHLSRLYFLSKGCKQVPVDLTGGKVLYAHPDGFFLNAIGRPMPHTFSPSNKTKGKHCFNGKRGNDYPCMRHFGSKSCHLLMALAFYGERRIFVDSRGKSYVGICHHLIPDVLNYRPANLFRRSGRATCKECVLLLLVLLDGLVVLLGKHNFLLSKISQS